MGKLWSLQSPAGTGMRVLCHGGLGLRVRGDALVSPPEDGEGCEGRGGGEECPGRGEC